MYILHRGLQHSLTALDHAMRSKSHAGIFRKILATFGRICSKNLWDRPLRSTRGRRPGALSSPERPREIVRRQLIKSNQVGWIGPLCSVHNEHPHRLLQRCRRSSAAWGLPKLTLDKVVNLQSPLAACIDLVIILLWKKGWKKVKNHCKSFKEKKFKVKYHKQDQCQFHEKMLYHV